MQRFVFAIQPLQTSTVVPTIAKLCTRCRQTRGAGPICRNLTKNSIIESGWCNTLSILDVPSQIETLQSDGQAEGPRLICDLITKGTFIARATKDQLKGLLFHFYAVTNSDVFNFLRTIPCLSSSKTSS